MQNDVTPVAARNKAARVDGAKVQSDANLHVQVDPPTKRFHAWQQAPAWLLGFAAIGLGFLMVLRNYDCRPAGCRVDRRDPLGGRFLSLAVLDRRDRDTLTRQESCEEGDAARA